MRWPLPFIVQFVRRFMGRRSHEIPRISHYECDAAVFGKAKRFRRTLRMLATPASSCLPIGDEIRDAVAARQAGVGFGAVLWGYGSGSALMATDPTVVLANPADLRSLGNAGRQ